MRRTNLSGAHEGLALTSAFLTFMARPDRVLFACPEERVFNVLDWLDDYLIDNQVFEAWLCDDFAAWGHLAFISVPDGSDASMIRIAFDDWLLGPLTWADLTQAPEAYVQNPNGPLAPEA